MANEFNHNLDKITERELVPDIISRLTLGKPFKTDFAGPNNRTEIAPIGTNFQQLLESAICINDYSMICNIYRLKKIYITIEANSKKIYFALDKSYRVLKIISESNKYDITHLFTCDTTGSETNNTYALILDTNYGINDVLDIYYYSD